MDEETGTIYLQPRPTITQVGQIRVGLTVVSVVTRRWRDGDEKRCRLCPKGECASYQGSCTIQVIGVISHEEGPLYSTLHLPTYRPFGFGPGNAGA